MLRRPSSGLGFVAALVACHASAAHPAEPATNGRDANSTMTVTIDDMGVLSSSSPVLAVVKELRIDATCTRTLETAVPIPAALGDLSGLEALRLGPEGRQDCDLVVTLPATIVKLKRLKTFRADLGGRPKPASDGRLKTGQRS